MTAPRPGGWDRRAIAAVVRRDLRVVRGSRAVVIPMIVVPVVLLVVLPVVLVWSARVGAAAVDLSDVERLLVLLPADVTARVAADSTAGLIEVALVYLLSPLLLLVPLMVAIAVAADAIAGERERRTLEGLLLTPLTDGELFAAKALGPLTLAAVVSVAGGVVYALVADLAAAGVVDRRLFPNLVWAVLVLWVGPAVAAVGLGATVLVSARVGSVQEAFQIAGVVVLPVVALVVSQSAGLLALSPALLLAGGAVAWAVAALILRAGAKAARRTRLGERL